MWIAKKFFATFDWFCAQILMSFEWKSFIWLQSMITRIKEWHFDWFSCNMSSNELQNVIDIITSKLSDEVKCGFDLSSNRIYESNWFRLVADCVSPFETSLKELLSLSIRSFISWVSVRQSIPINIDFCSNSQLNTIILMFKLVSYLWSRLQRRTRPFWK